MSRSSRYIEAFKESYNAVGLATAVAASAVLLTPIPLLAGAVLEAVYLLFVPDSKWYEVRLARRFDAEVQQRRTKLKDETLPLLRREMQDRFARLEQMRAQIDLQSQDDKTWFREVLRKLDYLLEKFLLFAAKEAQFRAYLLSLRDEVRGESRSSGEPFQAVDRRQGTRLRVETPSRSSTPAGPVEDPSDRWVRSTVQEVQDHYAQEQQQVEADLQRQPDDDTKAVLEKRRDVLARRTEFAGKIGKILLNLSHQLQLVEDTFGLINDEIRARSPEQILSDIDEVVVATDSMSTTLEELAPYEQIAARLAG